MTRFIPTLMATTALAFAFAVPMAPAQAAGAFDGLWIIDVQASNIGGEGTVPVCPALRLGMRITDNQVTGNFARIAGPEDNVVENGRGNVSRVTGQVQPDGSIATQWQNFHARGQLIGSSGKLMMQSECGPLQATSQRLGDESAEVATLSSTGLLVATAGQTASDATSGGDAYRVYFEFDRSKLTPESRATIAAAVQARRNDQRIEITLLGKADLSGTDPYNMALSKRRADAVRDAMIADGASVGRIGVRWVGDREPPVPTAAGVREAKNRVVEIALP
jgi:outer membrane protein OmpA-like peptidoglycan-associated protein